MHAFDVLGDPVRRRILEVLAGVRSRLGLSILLVEHRMEMVMEISDHVVALHAGGLIASGTSDEVIANPDVRRIYLGADDADD